MLYTIAVVTDRAPSDFDDVVSGAPAPVDRQSPEAPTAGDAAARTGSRLDDWWERRSPAAQTAWRRGGPALVLGVAAFTRLINLGTPHTLVFDETFYVKDAWTLWNLGYEAQWPAETDPVFAAGTTDNFLTTASYVVHPPLAKWLIGAGMASFGAEDSFGWRIATAVIGILAVALVMVLAKKLFSSTLLATIAGGLMAIEGNAIVMSRVSLLDNFVMFFALLGFGAVLLDRAWTERRLDRWILIREKTGRGIDWGPALWWRPWLIAAGAALGFTAAVKWSGLYFLAFFAVYTLVVDAMARRRAGVPFFISGTIWKQAPTSFLLTVPVAIAAYLLTWTGWFRTSGGYYRGWATEAGNAWQGVLAWVPTDIQSFWHYHVAMYNYHVGESTPHPYSANPLTWLLLVRPTAMYYQGSALGESGCASTACGSMISGLANPLIWWAAVAAALYLVYRLVRFREWRVGLILTGLAAGYLPWLMYLNRTVYQFYSIAFEPYLLLALTLVIGMILGSPTDERATRSGAIRLVVVFFAIAAALSVFFWPMWTGAVVDFDYLRAHWWLPTWR